jgi:hypothetical protein
MKIKLLPIALMAAVIGLGACGGDDPKSSECEILTFTVDGVAYSINGTSITHKYDKIAPDTYQGMPTWPVAPQITYSEKATIDPLPSVAKNFEEGATYTVTAEDGTTKTYTVTVDRGE